MRPRGMDRTTNDGVVPMPNPLTLVSHALCPYVQRITARQDDEHGRGIVVRQDAA